MTSPAPTGGPGRLGPGPERRCVQVHGVVQGVGFRPFVYALAGELSLAGRVWNTGDGVSVEIQGRPEDVASFCQRVRADAPPLARVDVVTWETVPVLPYDGFVIDVSRSGGGRTLIPADVATCPQCLAELWDPTDRRYRHPFITCTSCGPRFTIVTRLPYDRPSTTMAGFPLCPACAREYADPADRRFHAQPVCCHDCGPVLDLFAEVDALLGDRSGGSFAGRDENPFGARDAGPFDGGGECDRRARGERALARARELLRTGHVVAVKGLGGYHLACDATDPVAVARLRERKHRGDKPFAVLVADLATARTVCRVDDAEAVLLTSARRPIVLLRRRQDGPAAALVATQVAPGNSDLGVMLPPTALHHLLLGGPGDPAGPPALVMTSGNLSDEPIVTDDREARARLTGIADAWLWHDRPIHVPCDDSVTRVVSAREAPVRRSRGYAPLPVMLPEDVVPLLAVGGDLKNTFAMAAGRHAWLSAHVGDMGGLANQQVFARAVDHLGALVGVRPERVIADLHPGYRSSRWAMRRAAEARLPLVRVQHHHAHIAAVLAEHGHDPRSPAIGVAFDGTGYGTDGAVWGGEVLLGGPLGFVRFAHLRYAPMPGGDAAVRRPYRMALAHLHTAGIPWTPDLPCVAACSSEERGVLAHQLETGLGCVPTSSVGRLFDAVASVAGMCQTIGFEAQAAMALEHQAGWVLDGDDSSGWSGGVGRYGGSRDGVGRSGTDLCGPEPGRRGGSGVGSVLSDACHRAGGCHPLPLVPVTGGGTVSEHVRYRLDGAALIRAVVAEVRAGVPAPVVAARFHTGLVAAVVTVVERAREETGADVVALSGGVFANAMVSHLAAVELADRGFTVLRHRRVPCNDGGLALGQVAIAGRREVTPLVTTREPTTTALVTTKEPTTTALVTTREG